MAEHRSKKISRRTFLRASAVAGGALILGGVGYRLYRNHQGRDYDPERSEAVLADIEPSKNPSELTNIIIIFVDDLGYGDLGPYREGFIETPNLDRMAENGLSMNQFYATAPVCSPSRAGLLTGRYPIRSHVTLPFYTPGHPMRYLLMGVRYYPYDVLAIPEDELLLPEMLLRRGYRTGMVGKWHLGDRSPSLPNDCGFESFYGPLVSNDIHPYRIYRDYNVEIDAPVNQDMLTQNHTREAVDFIREHADDPFFLYLSHPMVHEPIHASDQFRGRSDAGIYGDAVEELDWSTGEVLRTLKDLGLEERTLVIFTSDNGPWWQGNAGMTTRGRKRNVFEGGFRVPFIAQWPGVIPPGTYSDELSVNYDLFSTCLHIAGIDVPGDRIIDGKNVLPVWSEGAKSPHSTFYYYDAHKLVAVRHQNWKYHRRHWTENGGYPLISAGPFLFDLQRDPNESYSLIDSEPEIAAELSSMMDEWDEEINENTRGWLT
ncbi:MAG: sulfatase-like hydrolase/transferase [Anaerolineales bacterium]|nr:sulfatase-like hydrolase/transferase [Anaerolineales bacterium]